MLYILNTKRLTYYLIHKTHNIHFINLKQTITTMEDIEDMFKNDGGELDNQRIVKKKVVRKTAAVP